MKNKFVGGIFVLIIITVTVFNVNINSTSKASKLSLLSLANIDALANNDEIEVSGARKPDYSWTSNEETHWEGECLVTTYASHVGCLSVSSDGCYPGVTTMRQRTCPN